MDIEYLLFLQQLRELMGPYLEMVISLLSNLTAAAAIAIPFIIFWAYDKREGRVMIAAFAGSLMLNQIIKAAAAVYRPWIRDARIVPAASALSTATGYSFPSAHTQAAATAFGGLALNEQNRKKRLVYIFLILFTAFSRNLLGVHTPQDVLCGIACAFVMLYAASFVFRWMSANKKRELIFAGCAVMLVLLSVAFAMFKEYPMDYADGVLIVDPKEMIVDFMLSAGLSAGLLSGGVLEHIYVGFSAECGNRTKIKRIVSGLAAAGLIYLVLRFLTPLIGTQVTHLIQGFCIGFYAVCIHPVIIKKYM